MAETIILTDPAVKIAVRRNARARRISLRVSRHDGAVRMTLPPFVALAEGRDFALSRAGWIRSQIAQKPAVARIAWGGDVPLRGDLLRLERGAGRVPVVETGRLIMPDGDRLPARLRGFLRDMARADLAAAADDYAQRAARSYGRITLRDTRSRWGSCTSAGNLMFSWRLIMAPPDVLRYVAAHEVAHLVHMDHSPAFWRQVGHLMPGWEAQRDWLRRKGAGLLAVDFSD